MPSRLDRLFALDLLAGVGAARRDQVASELDFVTLAAGQQLFEADHLSEALFIIVEGVIELELPSPYGGDPYWMRTRTVGQTLGDFAFLNRSQHLVQAIVREDALVARLSPAGFDALCEAHSALRPVVYDAAAELGRHVLLANLFLDLFEQISCTCMHVLLQATCVQHHRGGERIFEAGTEPDGLHVVVSGRLVTERVTPDGKRRAWREYRAPDVIGLVALLSGMPRPNDLLAARASLVAHVPRADFERVVLVSGPLMTMLTRRLLQRIAPHLDQLGDRQNRPVRPRTFALLKMNDLIPLEDLVDPLVESIGEGASVIAADAARFEKAFGVEGASRTRFDALLDPSIARWLDDRESRHDAVLYLGGPELDAWMERIANRADRILLLVDATDDVQRAARWVQAIRERVGSAHYSPPLELVLLHPQGTRLPQGTAAWLDALEPARLHHVRRGDRTHIESLARRLDGRERGLVLSSGGARGYAHLGVHRLFEERNIRVDNIGGTSMGALLGAAMAMGHAHGLVAELSSRFANRRALFDYTLPMVSVMRSRKLTRFCREVCGDVNIEDMWTPFFAVSSNLTDGSAHVHDRGPLWLAVRSSISLPGLFSPVPTEHGELLVDGAVLDGFPVAQMRKKLGGLGELYGVNVSRVPEPLNRFGFGSDLSGWRMLLSKLSPFHTVVDAPRVIETLLRSTDIKDVERNAVQRALVDVLIEPDVSAWALLDFKQFAAISDVGYEAARRVLDGESADPLAAGDADLIERPTLALAEQVRAEV